MSTSPVRVVSIAVVTVLFAACAPAPIGAQQTDSGCDLCHGEVELLRQHVTTLADARRLSVVAADIQASAHAGESCASCHTGYARWPHPVTGTTTESCVSCHEEAGAAWEGGNHAHPTLEGLEPADCADCHTTHDVLSVERLQEADGIRTMNAQCVACHETETLPVADPHADTVSCAGCHAPHETFGADDARASVAPLAQIETCGACHEDAAAAYPVDAHGAALAKSNPGSLAALTLLGVDGPATCTSCHGTHGMVAVADSASTVLHVDTCASCHRDEADRYFGTYHGKATALGSTVVASCDDCHGAHGIYAASEPASWVHEGSLIETCGECHAYVRPAFVAYDSHPNPMDPSRNKPLFLAFVLMNTLLFGVLIVFGLHTLLWWVRILIDRRKGPPTTEGAHG